MTSQPKDGWDIANILASITVSVVIPIVIAGAAWHLESSLREGERGAQTAASDRDTRLRAFEVAVGILQQAPEGDRGEISVLRKWAIRIFMDFSGEDIPGEVKMELERKALPGGILSRGAIWARWGDVRTRWNHVWPQSNRTRRAMNTVANCPRGGIALGPFRDCGTTSLAA